MDYKEVVDKIKPELEKIALFLESELKKVRTGRASPALVEDIMIDVFGQKLPLKQLGSISCPEPRQILIQPWDKSYLEPIEKAISRSNLGFSIVVDKDAVRLSIPPMTEEFRGQILRLISQKQEEAKESVRRWRDVIWKEIQQLVKEGKLREDDKFRGKDYLQKLVDECNEKLESLVERKKKELAS